jgi:hypothetical protein
MGGRCGPSGNDTGCVKKEDTQGVSTAYSALLQAREAQMKMWESPIAQTQLVVKDEQKGTKKESKKDIIDIILNGDSD